MKRPRTRLLLAVALLVLLVGSPVVLDLIPRATRHVTPRGSIYVGSPEVYTRERLVNDRYEQDEWLRDQLKKTDQLDFSPRARFSRAARRSTTLEAGFGTGAKTTSETADAGLPEATAAGTTTPSRQSPIDEFQDRASYREEVRAELIENQLDDRHDLGGNTLYRFKFDCAVIPAAGNGAYAVIGVRPALSGGDGDAGPARELYGSWLRQFLADARATFEKRFDDAWAVLGALSAPVLAGGPRNVTTAAQDWLRTMRPQIQSDLKQIRDDLAQKLPDACPIVEADRDILVAQNLTCLLDERRKEGKTDRKTLFRALLADSFAERVGRPYERLGHLTSAGGELEMEEIRVLDAREPRHAADALDQRFETGFENFGEIITTALTVYTYAVAPKEMADRLAQQTVLGDSRGMDVAAALPLATASGNLAAADRRERQVYASLIERNPRIVGFSSALNWQAADFGWILGPRFAMPEQTADAPKFHQQPAHYSLSAIVSAPSWWTKAQLQILVYWLDPEDGSCTTEQGAPINPCPTKEWKPVTGLVRRVDVELPGDPRLLGDIVTRRIQASGATDDLKQPAIAKADMDVARLQVGAPAEVVIPGQNLWRSPLITLGAQQAKRIKVLPNMNGLVAYFESIDAPAGWTGPEPFKDVRLTVWTSQKHPDSVVGKVWIYPAPAKPDTEAPLEPSATGPKG